MSIIVSTSGNDIFSGNSGDFVVYSSESSRYRFRVIDEFLVVADTSTGNRSDGTDLVGGIRNLSFSDGTVRFALRLGEFRANSYVIGSQESPSVASLADGSFIVTWTSYGQDGSGGGIYSQLYDAGGNAIYDEFAVNTTSAGNQTQQSVAGLSDGGAVVVWSSEGQDGDGSGIYAQRLNNLGSSIGSQIRVNSHTANDQTGSSVAALPSGGFVVVWTSMGQDGSGLGIFGQRYNAAGVVVGDEFPVSIATSGDQRGANVTALADDGFVVAWTSGDIAGDGVYIRRYDSFGNPGSVSLVNTYTTGVQDEPRIAALADGGFVVTWTSWGVPESSGWGLMGRRYDTLQNPGADFVVHGSPWVAYDHQVIGLADGGFVVVFSQEGVDGSGYATVGRKFDTFGNAGREFLINTYTNSHQADVSIAALSDGGFVVTWTSNNPLSDGDSQDGDGPGVFGQRFDALGRKVDLVMQGTGEDNSFFWSGTDNILLSGEGGSDSLKSGAGNDAIAGAEGDDTLSGSGGKDYLAGGADDDVLNAGAGADFLVGGEGDDTLNGGAGVDTMFGGVGNDLYFVTNLGDTVVESSTTGGIDLVKSKISFSLGAYLDNLALVGINAVNGTGNSFANTISGNTAANTLTGNDGNDILSGGEGHDKLLGGNHNDRLYGGFGSDSLTGGAGNDRFIFDTGFQADEVDTIIDFTSGSDRLWFSTAAFTGLGERGRFDSDDVRFHFAAGANRGHDASDRLVYNTATGDLYYDSNGDASGGAALVAKLGIGKTLLATDIVVI